MFRVTYSKLAIMPAGGIGNISQGTDVAFMDCDFAIIKDVLNAHLLDKHYVAVIETVDRVGGHIVR